MKFSAHSVCSERLTQVYKGTSPRGIGYIDLKRGYMGKLALKSFKGLNFDLLSHSLGSCPI